MILDLEAIAEQLADPSTTILGASRTPGERLALWRVLRGWSTQGELADVLGWDHTVISSWERGRHAPSAEARQALAALGFHWDTGAVSLRTSGGDPQGDCAAALSLLVTRCQQAAAKRVGAWHALREHVASVGPDRLRTLRSYVSGLVEPTLELEDAEVA